MGLWGLVTHIVEGTPLEGAPDPVAGPYVYIVADCSTIIRKQK